MRLGPPPQLLICVFGSMTCQFQGNSFTFNIEIWLPRTFPFQAPLVFVCPTGNQRIRSSSLVDPSGRVLHSYLSYWHTRPTSTLIEMMNYLHQAFCQDPPIFLEQPRQAPPPPPPAATPAPRSAAQTSQPVNENTTANLIKLRGQVKEKLVKKYKQLQQDISIDTDRILAENSLLSENENKIKKSLSELRQEIIKVKDEIGQSKARNESLAEQIQVLKAGGDVDLDRLIVPQGAISKQVMREVVSDLVLQDTMYALTKAFEKKQIELASFLRMTRDLARDQFKGKALLLKVREQFPVLS